MQSRLTDGRRFIWLRSTVIPMITLLLEHGAKINPVDAKGWTPLDRAKNGVTPMQLRSCERMAGKHRKTEVSSMRSAAFQNLECSVSI